MTFDDQYELVHPIIQKYKEQGMNIALLSSDNKGHDFTALYLHRIIVPPEQRGTGLGTRFMVEFTKWCDQENIIVGTVPLCMEPENQNQFLKFFSSFGFKHVSDVDVKKYWHVITGDYIRLPAHKIDYTKYYDLTPYQQKCILTTNFWLIVNGLEPIQVPPENREFWSIWNRYYNKKAAELNDERTAWLARQ